MPRSSRWPGVVARGAGLALFTLSLLAAAQDIESLRAQWSAAGSPAAYSAVARELIRYRVEQRFSRTADVDYMIATSLCRTADRKSAGSAHFEYILANYSLSPESRATVISERDRCTATTATAAGPMQVAFNTLPGQAGGIRSKLFYWLGRDDAAVNTDPVKVVEPKSADTLRSRLFRPGEQAAAVEKIRAEVGSGYRVIATPNFVLASAGQHTDSQLEEIGATMDRFLNFYVRAYDMRFPEYLVTVYVLPDTYTMRQLALDLHGIKINSKSIGYAFRDDMSILGVVPGTTLGTLAHELFHVLTRDIYGDTPPWLDEGVAALYEVSNVSGKYLPSGRDDEGRPGAPTVGGQLAVRGIPNWRGCVLRSLWLERQGPQEVYRPGIAELATMNWQQFSSEQESGGLLGQQAVNHATARYLALYLQDTGALFDLFTDFGRRDPFALEGTVQEDALMRVDRHLEGSLEEADARFEAWLIGTITAGSCG